MFVLICKPPQTVCIEVNPPPPTSIAGYTEEDDETKPNL